jgi:hypothetical protein
MQNKDPTRFYYQNKTKKKQGYDKKHTKTGVEHIEGNNGEFYPYLSLLNT